MTKADKERQDLIFNPDYQMRMMLIEEATRKARGGGLPPLTYPDTYDDALLKLIDSVPMEH